MDSLSIKETLMVHTKSLSGKNNSLQKFMIEPDATKELSLIPVAKDKVELTSSSTEDQTATANQYGQLGRQGMIAEKRVVDNWLARRIDTNNDGSIGNEEFLEAQKAHPDVPLKRMLGDKPGFIKELEKTDLGEKIDFSADGRISRKELISFMEQDSGRAEEMAKEAVLEARPQVDSWLARKIDRNDNGRIERDEFFKAQKEHPHTPLGRALGDKPEIITKLEGTKLGKQIDSSGDGAISRRELYTFKTQNNMDLKEAILDAVEK